MTDTAHHPVLNGPDLDKAIEHARAALAAVLGAPAGGDGAAYPCLRPGDWGDWAGRFSYPGHRLVGRGDEPSYPKMIAEARALLGILLAQRLVLAAGRTGERDRAAIAAVRADRNEAIAVHAALLYWLPVDNPAWPDVAMTVGRLSYDRYSDPWPEAEAPDPDDLDAACDLLLRAARRDEADERTARYLVLALRDRQRLLACPADTSALMAWGERLLAFPDAGGLDRARLHDLLELEVTGRAESLAQRGSWDPADLRSLRLAPAA
ncbi:MAG: hypothetical protein ABSB76_06365 [Streptosporangiaceae bacterium]|jgi:hypothetical protein